LTVIRRVTRAECERLVVGVHYAHRWPSITYAFGLFRDDVLVGCVTYGTPASSTLRNGIAGEDFAASVLELNRLVLDHNIKNDASMLVSGSLRLIGGDHIVISFADTEQGHRGIVYQASNFSYHGLSAKRTDWKVRGMEHLHGITIADQFRGVANRAQAMRDKYGDDFYLAPRPRKHRYIKIVGSKGFKVKAAKAIKYERMPYP
jgi:hypothetical protein